MDMSVTQNGSTSSTPALQSNPAPTNAPSTGDSGTPGCYTVDPDALRNLIVNYLPPLMNEAQVYELFGQFGKIESVKIIYDKITAESRGYGFVKFYFFFSATYAISCLNRFEIGGKKLKVAYANALAAKEAYDALRLSTVALNPQQQQAMKSMYYNQMVLSKEQEVSAAAMPGMSSSNPMIGGAGYDPYMHNMDCGGYPIGQRSVYAGYAHGMPPGMVPVNTVYRAGSSTEASRVLTPAMTPAGF
ncbi:hypothetical protein JKF63_04548 [Porcisia hertigi]|uniref:RRM domain-containing protein n=1 Tax=Porcisia hertigi TaxID=2761500 RepID=A0A836IT18_9TRYP|nr:hypothetical protein JKF63_04548 [Porcisia hertigi]